MRFGVPGGLRMVGSFFELSAHNANRGVGTSLSAAPAAKSILLVGRSRSSSMPAAHAIQAGRDAAGLEPVMVG